MIFLNKVIHYSGCIQSYGENCQYPCSIHCFNQTCDRFYGICQFGCENGYHGQKCEQGIFIRIWTIKWLTIYKLRRLTADHYKKNSLYHFFYF